jgi:acetate kinase
LRVLVVNAGSSSVKLSAIGSDDATVANRELAAPRATIDANELRAAVEAGLGNVDVVAHRIVHGGQRFRGAVLITREVEAELRQLVALAPLHQPKSLGALDAMSAALPGLPAVACFDTAFHATLPPAARTYALPAAWRDRWSLRRYGFHGLSHSWIARRVPQLLGDERPDLRIISCHLGAGASLCAIQHGRSLDTTMGFTPLEGLVMATRSGTVDPGLLLWLMGQTGMTEQELARALEYESGLLGLAGSADMQRVVARASAGEASAGLALDVYLHRLRAGIAAMAAALGGVDAVAFTGGVGEHAPAIRSGAAGALRFLGLAIDDRLNADARADCEITADHAATRVLVIQAREDLEIARQARALLEERPPHAGVDR